MCGKQTSLENFDPSGFAQDIMTQEVIGLGKGKGFKSTGRGSILGHNDTCAAIKDRALDILDMLLEHYVVTEKEIVERLGLGTPQQPEVEKDENAALKEEREESIGTIQEIIGTVEEILEAPGEYTVHGSDGIDVALARLRDAVGALGDAHSAMKEENREAMAVMQDTVNESEETLESYGEFPIDLDGSVADAARQVQDANRRALDEVTAARENKNEVYSP